MDRNHQLVAFLDSPQKFQQSFADLEHCRRMCHALGCDSSLIEKFDQCAADQKQLATQSSILAREVASQWVTNTIRWYKQTQSEVDVDKDEAIKLSIQAEEFSKAFVEIAKRARTCAGSLHDAQVTAKQKADHYRKESREAVTEMERYESRMNEALREAAEEQKTANEKSDTAENLRIAAWSTFFLPPVAIGLAVGASIVSTQSESAEDRAKSAKRAAEYAKSAKLDAECKQDKYQVYP